MNFNILTIFPEFFDSFKNTSIIKKALLGNLISIQTHNIRDYTNDKHKITDDTPFGGGSGMVMKAEPIIKGIASLKEKYPQIYTILFSPRGKKFDQKKAFELSKKRDLCLVCVRYEGVDDRVLDYIEEELSIGDYVLSGGEAPATILIDAVSRMVTGVLGNSDSLLEESFQNSLLEYPQYTRPEILPKEYGEKSVPKVLLSGNHSNIIKWRRLSSIITTFKRRPDLISLAELSVSEKDFLKRYAENRLSSKEEKFLKGEE